MFWGVLWMFGSIIVILAALKASIIDESYDESYAEYYEKEEIHKEMKL